MKINTFTSILSIALAGIIAFFLSFYVSGENKWIVGIGSLLSLGISLAGTVSLSFDYDRTTTLTRITSGVFFVALLISHRRIDNIVCNACVSYFKIEALRQRTTACRQYCLAAGATQGNIAYTQTVMPNF